MVDNMLCAQKVPGSISDIARQLWTTLPETLQECDSVCVIELRLHPMQELCF